MAKDFPFRVSVQDDATAKLQKMGAAAKREMGKVQEGMDDSASAGKKMAQVLGAVADTVESDFKQLAAVTERVGRELGDDAAEDAQRFATAIRAAGLTVEDIDEDCEELVAQLKRLETAGEAAGMGIKKGAGDASDGLDRVHNSSDQSRSVLANMAGNSAQDLGELGGVAGSAGVLIGQLAEYAADGNLSLAGMAKMAGPMVLLGVGVTAVTKTMESLNKRQQQYEDDTKSMTKAILDGSKASETLAERMVESGRVIATVTTENNVGEWLVSMGDEASHGTADVTDALDRLGMTVGQFSNLAAGSGEGIMTWRQSMTDAGLAGDDLNLVNNALWASFEQVGQAAHGAAVMERVLGPATHATAEEMDAAAAAGDAYRTALEDMNTAQDAAIGNNISLAEAMLNTSEALTDYAETMADAEASDLDKSRAGLDLIDTMVAEADAAGRSAADQARAAGDMAGASKASTDAQIQALWRLAGELAPGSWLRNQITDHINALNSIPTSINTSVRVNTSYGQGTAPLPSKGKYAAGAAMGPIPGAPGEMVPIDAHAGEIVLNQAQQKNIAAGLDGGGGGGTVVVQLHIDGRHIDDALVRLKRNNGTLGFEQ